MILYEEGSWSRERVRVSLPSHCHVKVLARPTKEIQKRLVRQLVRTDFRELTRRIRMAWEL